MMPTTTDAPENKPLLLLVDDDPRITELLKPAPEMRFVALSGQNDEVNARHARTPGAADFVDKPCHPSDRRRTHECLNLFTPAPEKTRNDARPSLIGINRTTLYSRMENGRPGGPANGKARGS